MPGVYGEDAERYIVGPTRLVVGQGATYVATDGAGTPYPDGVSWNTSVEHVMPVHDGGVAYAMKAGRATVIAHREEMTAYLDVEILVEVPNVTGLPVLQAAQRVGAAGLSGSSPGGGSNSPPSGDGPILPPGTPVGDPVNAPQVRNPAPPSAGSGGSGSSWGDGAAADSGNDLWRTLGGWDRDGAWHDGRAIHDHCRAARTWGWTPCRAKRGSCVVKVKILKDDAWFGVKAGEVRCQQI